MAISPDVLATALQELMPKYSELFTQWHPALQRMVLKGNFQRNVLSGPYREFNVVTDGPGTVTHVVSGSELVGGGRRQNAQKGNTYAPRMIYAYDVPAKDLAEANGEMDMGQIIKSYPELALSDFHERIADQLVVGNGTDVGGFLTLNGDTTYSPDGTARDGVFEFAPTTGQTDTVFGLLKSGGGAGAVPGWHNQYGLITSMSGDGRRIMRREYFRAGRQGSKFDKGIDLMLGDEASYLNYLEDLDDHVRVTSVENDHVPGKVREGVKFLQADFFLEDAIDITAFNGGAGRNGVIYGLATGSWHAYTLGHDAKRETKGFFDTRGPFRIPDQDAFRYELVLYMGMHCTQPRCNFVIEGGSIP